MYTRNLDIRFRKNVLGSQKSCTLKPRYSKQDCQTFFVHYIEWFTISNIICVVNPQNGSWIFFTISRNSQYRSSLFQGFSVNIFFEMLGNYKVCFTSSKVSNPNGRSLKIKISCCICLWVLFLLLCAFFKWIYFIWSHHIRIFIYTSFAESAFMFLTLTLLFFLSFFQGKNKYERHHKCIFFIILPYT